MKQSAQHVFRSSTTTTVICSARRLELRSASVSSIRRNGATIASASRPRPCKARKPVTFRVMPGRWTATEESPVGYFDAPPGKPTVIEFVESARAAHVVSDPPVRHWPGHEVVNAGSARTSTKARAWRCSGSRSKGRCTTPGRRRAIGASSATCRRSRPRHQRQGPRRGGVRATRRPMPSGSCATSRAGPFAAR